MKREAWLRAARMLAVCMVVMGAAMAAAPEAQAQKCGCTLVESNVLDTVMVEDCPVIVKYDRMICFGEQGRIIETAYIKEIIFSNTGCCVRLYANSTIAALVQSISVELMVQNPGVFPPGAPARVSKSPCWERGSTTTANILKECASTECCWIEGTGGSYSGATGRTFTTPPPCTLPCEYVCE